MKKFDDRFLVSMAYSLYIKGYAVEWIDPESFLMTGVYDNYIISISANKTNICVWCCHSRKGYEFQSIVRAINFLLNKEKGE